MLETIAFLGMEFSVSTLFWICLALGVCISLVSMFVGHLLDFANFDLGHFGPATGPVVSAFLVIFGGCGLVMRHLLEFSPVTSTVGASFASISGSALIYFIFAKFILSMAGGTTFDPKATAGTEAEVITQIPATGSGEITFDHSSGRISGPARSATGKPIERNTLVVIDRFVAGTYIVRPLDAPGGKTAPQPASN